MIKQLAIILLFTSFSSIVWSQKKDAVLFSVNDYDVQVSEFEYIYNKNNNDDNKYSEASIKEYLDLYVNFKLKVQAAKDMGLDTVQSLKDELATYQKQLANSYLIDKQVKDRILKEAYKRSLYDVELAHIMVTIKRNASPKDTAKSYQRITQAYNQLQKSTFEQVAKEYSDDKKSANNGGRIGFIHATLPNGFYDFETAAYTLKKGQYSAPIRSNLGYHIIKVLDRRDARGEMEAAQILIRKPKDAKSKDTSKDRIDVIYKALQEGADWDEKVKAVTEDKLTKDKKGSLGFFGINKFNRAFEDAAFGLKNDGDISKPVQSKIGWHIIKRISKKEILPFKQAKFAMDQKLKNDDRIKAARQSMIRSIKKNASISENTSALNLLTKGVDTLSFYTFKWKGFNDVKLPAQELFSINELKFSIADFEKHLLKEKGSRNRAGRLKNHNKSMNNLYHGFMDESLLEYEKTQLVKKYPDFKALMREYDEGILLFEATKLKIWDYALEDSVGLKKFYMANRGNYNWDQRIDMIHYQIQTALPKEAAGIAKFVRNGMTAQEAHEEYSHKVKYTKVMKPVTSKGIPEGIEIKKGFVTEPVFNKKNKTYDFYKVENVLEPSPKKLNEARGFVIADYQDQLEKEWIASLKEKYDIQVNKKVLKKLIK